MSSSTSIIGERKRSRKEMENASSNRQCNNSNTQEDGDKKTPAPGPLQGVIACLSGLAQDRKEELHRLILSMDGRYVQSFSFKKLA